MCEDDEGAASPGWKGSSRLEIEQQYNAKAAHDQEIMKNEGENSGRNISLPRHVIPEQRKFLSGSLIPDNAFSPKKPAGEVDR